MALAAVALRKSSIKSHQDALSRSSCLLGSFLSSFILHHAVVSPVVCCSVVMSSAHTQACVPTCTVASALGAGDVVGGAVDVGQRRVLCNLVKCVFVLFLYVGPASQGEFISL